MSGTSVLTPRVVTFDRESMRLASKRLAAFQACQFSHITSTVIPTLFPDDSQHMLPYHVPIIRQMCRQIGNAYDLPPERAFRNLTDLQARSLGDEYRRIGANRVLQTAQRAAVVQGTMIGILYPRRGRIYCRLLHPWQVEVDPDPDYPESLSAATEVRALWPVRTTDRAVHYGLLRMTRERLAVEAGSQSFGLWSADESNPFADGYPAWSLRTEPAEDGSYFSPVGVDALDAQIGVTVAWTSAMYTAEHSSWGQDVFSGMTQATAREIRGGPSSPIGLREGQGYEHVQRGSSVQAYLEVAESYLRTVGTLNNIAPDRLTHMRSAITAVAKMVDRADREEARIAQRPWLERAEQSFLRALLMVLRQRGDLNRYPERAFVDVEYRSSYYPADPLHEAQARSEAYRNATSSPIRAIMQERGFSRAAAEAEWRMNMRINREAGLMDPALETS